MGKTKYRKLQKRRKGGTFLKGIFIFSFLIIGLFLFLTKSSFLNVNKVTINGDNLTLEESLKEKGDTFLGENLLFVKAEDVEERLMENPYVQEVKISKKLPNNLILEVKESDIAFYVGKGKNAYILSSKLRVLEKNNNGNLNGDIKNLVEIVGIDTKGIEIGNELIRSDDKIIETICQDIYKIKAVNKTKHKITKVDFSNLSSIKVWFDKVEVRVGDGTDFIRKINDSLNILEDKSLNMQKGYIDLSFNGSPIINRNEKGEK